MDKFEKKPITGGSDFFQSLAKIPQYKRMEKLVQKSLEDQWNDIIISGVVKTLYTNYPKFFINRRGIKTKLKKSFRKQDEDDIRSEGELRALMTENLQQDKISVTSRSLNMPALLIFMGVAVSNRSKSVISYNRFRPEMNGYLKNMANKGGQSIIDQIVTPKPIKFRLSKRDLVNQIKSRTDTLIKGMNATTKKKFVNQLAIGIRKGERKSVMIKRLQKAGLDISKERARKIVMTETVAVSEWMRGQTAMMNGATIKIWVTAEDERVCDICEPLDGGTIGITSNFKSDIAATETRQGTGFTGGAPPAHALCRCTVRYEFKECGDFVKESMDVFDRITEMFEKAKNTSNYKLDRGGANKCQNPEAVWGGGESLVGRDKNIGNVFNEIKDLKGNEKKNALIGAKNKLTDTGYAQLRLKLGLNPIVQSSAKPVAEKLFNENWKDIIDSKRREWGVLPKGFNLSIDEFNALRLYTDPESHYAFMNQHLRAGLINVNTSRAIKLKALSSMLDSALIKLPKVNKTIYRGFRMKKEVASKLIKQLKISKVYIDSGYGSASLSRAVGEDFAQTFSSTGDSSLFLEINSKTSREVNKFSIIRGEKEVIIPRNTKFMVNKINQEIIDGVTIYNIKLDEIISKGNDKKNILEKILHIADKDRRKQRK